MKEEKIGEYLFWAGQTGYDTARDQDSKDTTLEDPLLEIQEYSRMIRIAYVS